MSPDSEHWTDYLVEEIRETEEVVKELQERKPAALSELKAIVERDIERLDKGLYSGKHMLEVTQEQKDKDGPDFTIISRAGINYVKMHVWILPRDYILFSRLFIRRPDDSKPTEKGGSVFKIVADEYGGFMYLDTYGKEVEIEEVSRQLVEPAVKEGSGLDFDLPTRDF